MNTVLRVSQLAMVAGPEGEMQMDQRKPAVAAQASEMSRRDAARSGQPEAGDGSAAQASAPAVDRLISKQLRALYDEVVNEPIPDRFLELLEELERKQAGKP